MMISASSVNQKRLQHRQAAVLSGQGERKSMSKIYNVQRTLDNRGAHS